MSTSTKRIITAIVRYTVWAIIGWALVQALRPEAIAFRGNESYGGEVLLYGLPLYVAAFRVFKRDAKAYTRTLKEQERGQADG